jgi:hypothetical protein
MEGRPMTSTSAFPSDPYDDEGYCEYCGNDLWQQHGPECAWPGGTACAATLTVGNRTRSCVLGREHDGRHSGEGAYWWHGNGEACEHEWLDRPESDTRECLICGREQ